MLSPTDIHFLVGFLTLNSSPDCVEVELGSLVMDDAAIEHRDVDVTVVKKEKNGQVSAYSGIEVKRHKRPLDSTHVEQLCCKLNDMSSLTRKAIVSASGFYEPAIRKASAHSIELYELQDWKNPSKGFEHFQATSFPSVHVDVKWVDRINVKIRFDRAVDQEDRNSIAWDAPLFRPNGSLNDEVPSLRSLIDAKKSDALYAVRNQVKPIEVKHGEIRAVHVDVVISDSNYVNLPSGRLVVKEINYDGHVMWGISEHPTTYKILQKVGDDKPLAGCCLFDVPGWGLCGLTISNTDRDIRFINIPVSVRNLNKIFRHSLRKSEGEIETTLE